MPLLKPPAYDTPEDHRPGLGYRLLPWNRFQFYLRTIPALLKGRRQAVRGEFDDAAFAARAEDILLAVEACGGKVHVTGIEHIAETPGSMVFVGNHMSMLETFLLPAAILPYKTAGFVLKASLGKNWLMGPVVEAQQAIKVGRENPREDLAAVLQEGADRLERGRSVIIFPQGTRSHDFPVNRFNTLGAKLARRANVPMIPFALKTDFLENGRWLKDLGPVFPERDVRMSFGAPIMDVTNQREAHEQCLDFVRSTLAQWGVASVE
jgi:1-acyl-sn-glycerol-3-phosphate acyltransferase